MYMRLQWLGSNSEHTHGSASCYPMPHQHTQEYTYSMNKIRKLKINFYIYREWFIWQEAILDSEEQLGSSLGRKGVCQEHEP